MRKIIGTVAAGVFAAATIILTSGYASASNYHDLCVYSTSGAFQACAYGRGSEQVAMTPELSSTTNWHYPNSGTGEIQQANTNLCMQLDASAGYIVIEATCNGASYQEWTAHYVTVLQGGATYYTFQSKYDSELCLADDASNSTLYTRGCNTNWYEAFYSNN